MTLEEKVNAIVEVYNALDREITKFQTHSTLHCKFGCGKCCFKPDIEATVLEFLPFAAYLHQQGLAFDWLDKLKANPSSVCLILNPTQSGAGLCSEYTHRGLICRLFGFSARTNKYGKRELVTCEIIKTEQKDRYEEAVSEIENNQLEVPLMHSYYLQLTAIDLELTRDFYPINQAIKRAIETVLAYYAYR
jgi:uncharacterized protein